MGFVESTTTLLAIGEWDQCGKLIFSALGNGWSVLHSSRAGDLSAALQRRKIDLILLAGCAIASRGDRAAVELSAAREGIAMVVLDGGGGQDLLMDALVGARPWTVESDRDPDEPYVPGTPEPAPLAGSVRQSNVTSSLSLLEPVCHQVSTDMRRALEFIEVHFREPISLADVARAASYSRCHFCKLFRQQLGLSFVTYLSHVRIRRAMVLLARSDRSITEIAFDVGFNDLSHFERVFRAVQGQTPTRFRQIAKQSPDRGQDPPSARSLAVTSCIVSTVTGVRSAADAHVSCHPGSQLACRPRTGRPMHQSTSVPGSTESSPRREDGVIKYQVGAPAAGGTSPAPTTPGARSAAGSSGGDPP